MPLKPDKEGKGIEKGKGSKTAFVSGGGGKVGMALSKALLENGYKVHALSHQKDFVHTMPAGVIPFVGEITDEKIINEACRGVDVVFHLAAIVSEYKAPTKRLLEVNVEGTKNVLEACRRNGIKHIIFSSSIDVYGRTRKEKLTEESRLRPEDKYGYSKMLAEKEVHRYGNRIGYTILRVAAIYGNGFERSYFKLFEAVKDGKAYIIGDGNNSLALVHIDDVVNAFMLSAEKRNSINKVYNVGDGVAYTQSGLMDKVAGMLGVEKPRRHISPVVVKLVARSRGLDSDELRFLMSDRIIDISAIKRDLGFNPRVNIDQAGLGLVKDFIKKRGL